MKILKNNNWTYIVFKDVFANLETALKLLISMLNGPHVVYLNIQIKENENCFKTVNHQIILDQHSNVEKYLDVFEAELIAKEEGGSGTIDYTETVAFKFRPINVQPSSKKPKWATKEDVKNSQIKKKILNADIYPESCKEQDLGHLIYERDNIKGFKYSNTVSIEKLPISSNKFKYTVFKRNIPVFTYIDTINANGTWIRTFNKLSKYYDDKNNLIKIETSFDVKYIQPLNPATKLNENILTLDIETRRLNDGNMEPIALAVCYGEENVDTFYLTEYASIDQMIITCFQFIMNNYPNSVVYAHNMGGFDSYFFLNSVLKLYEITPIMKDSRFISLTVAVKQNKFYGEVGVKQKKIKTFKILDSFNLLPKSLRSLAEIFKLPIQKGHFPFELLNLLNLNYIGNMPDRKYFTYLTETEYCEQNAKFWSLKENLLIYLKKDVIVLRLIVIEFQKFIFEHFNVDITKSSTMSGLALKIIRTNFFDSAKDKLIILDSKLESLFRTAYFGGRVEVFRPILHNGNGYDINGLYPSIMAKLPMPGGSMKHFRFIKPVDFNYDFFGLVYVSIKTPENLYNPVLPFRLENKSVIYPIGSFTGWYTTVDIVTALSRGYEVKVFELYQFEQIEGMFKGFVDYLNNLKINSTGIGAHIAKMIQNFGFGKLGAHEYNAKVELVSAHEADIISSQYTVLYQKELPGSQEMIVYVKNSGAEKALENKTNNQQTSLITAMFLTAAGRGINAYLLDSASIYAYTDTDSFFIAGEYPAELIDPKELGKLKLVYSNFKEAKFVAPKVYGITNQDGTFINKAKGLGPHLTMDNLTKLMETGQFETSKTIWQKNLSESTITLKNIPHKLRLSNNKRLKIINENGWFDTAPHKVYNNQVSPLAMVVYQPLPNKLIKFNGKLN